MLIKNASAGSKLGEAVVLNLRDLERDALEIVATARRQAEALIDAARQEGRRLAEEARARAHAEGLEAGLAEGRAKGERDAREATLAEFRPQVESVLGVWQAAVDRWERERGAMLTRAREDVLEFACQVARQVVHRQIAVDPTVVADQLRTALELLTAPTAVEVAVHPDDRPLVETVLGDLTGRLGGCDHIALRDDASIDRGGCFVTTSGGTVDATIETQLAVITAALVPGA